ncbi:phage tail protein [Nannocystis sp.]|uniref:phage tail protein n=1 Tax=Nannocystis sp. TaxID=1962667 RepID=UPI0025F49F49|nr:phage tail protein [Nannocystis sp.]MBK7823656.1 hypothetical protein [Nannocystis sp.]
MDLSRPFALLHTEDQWRRAAHDGTTLQPGTGAVELAWSQAEPATSSTPAPLAAGLAFDAQCRLHRSLPEAGRIERSAPTGQSSAVVDLFAPPAPPQPGDFSSVTTPIPALASPRGLAIDDDNRLFVAEHGKARILVVDLVERRLLRSISVAPARPLDLACDGRDVFAVLDRAPHLIRLTARTGPFPLVLPVHVSGAPARIAQDRSGALHLLTDAGTPLAAVASLALAYQTLAIPGATDLEITADDVLVVARAPGADFSRHALRPHGLEPLPAMRARGYDGRGIVRTPAGAIAFWTEHGVREAIPARVRYARSGRVTSFRLDAGAYQAHWGRIFVDACIPPGTTVRVCCVTADEPPDDLAIPRTPPANNLELPLLRPDLSPPMPPASLVPADDAAYHPLYRRAGGREVAWSEPAPHGFATYEAPVLAAPGRYLWLFLALTGDARFTPRIRSVRVEHSAHTLLDRLPAVFSREPENAAFLGRYLALADGFLHDLELRALHRRALLDPAGAPDEWLPWLAGFVGLVLDDRWPAATRRAVLAEATWLFRYRGTVPGLTRFLELYLGRPPILLEQFRLRGHVELIPGHATAVVGAGLRVGGSDDRDRFGDHAHRFTVLVPGHLSAEQETIVRHILADHRPAHTTFDLCTLAAGMRVGIGLHAGLTSTVGNSASFTPLQVGASVLGRGVVVGSPGPATIPGASRLGVDTRVA